MQYENSNMESATDGHFRLKYIIALHAPEHVIICRPKKLSRIFLYYGIGINQSLHAV